MINEPAILDPITEDQHFLLEMLELDDKWRAQNTIVTCHLCGRCVDIVSLRHPHFPTHLNLTESDGLVSINSQRFQNSHYSSVTQCLDMLGIELVEMLYSWPCEAGYLHTFWTWRRKSVKPVFQDMVYSPNMVFGAYVPLEGAR